MIGGKSALGAEENWGFGLGAHAGTGALHVMVDGGNLVAHRSSLRPRQPDLLFDRTLKQCFAQTKRPRRELVLLGRNSGGGLQLGGHHTPRTLLWRVNARLGLRRHREHVPAGRALCICFVSRIWD